MLFQKGGSVARHQGRDLQQIWQWRLEHNEIAIPGDKQIMRLITI